MTDPSRSRILEVADDLQTRYAYGDELKVAVTVLRAYADLLCEVCDGRKWEWKSPDGRIAGDCPACGGSGMRGDNG